MAMPDSTAPTSRGKMKASAELSKWDVERKSASLGVTICLRNIDGKKELIGTCNEYSVGGGIPIEYTSKEKFKEYVVAKIDAIYEALQ